MKVKRKTKLQKNYKKIQINIFEREIFEREGTVLKRLYNENSARYHYTKIWKIHLYRMS